MIFLLLLADLHVFEVQWGDKRRFSMGWGGVEVRAMKDSEDLMLALPGALSVVENGEKINGNHVCLCVKLGSEVF